jgi:hypothetical protein
MPHRPFGKDKPGRETLGLRGFHDIGELGRHHILLVLIRVRLYIMQQSTMEVAAKPHTWVIRVTVGIRMCGLTDASKAKCHPGSSAIPLVPLMIKRGAAGCSPYGEPRGTPAR